LCFVGLDLKQAISQDVAAAGIMSDKSSEHFLFRPVFRSDNKVELIYKNNF